MATQIIMDRNGDSRYQFDPQDPTSVAEACKRFEELVASGFTAAARTSPGKPVVTHKFDPTANETLFFPRLVGG